jgi:hypothetical protein
MAKPKLALIPSAQGSKFYSVLPSSGVGDFDFTRSGSATRINSQGLIESVANGVSRLNYPMIDGVVKGCPHHILEPQRTNLIQYSEDFSNAWWLKLNNVTVSAEKVISPDGTLNASQLVFDGTSGGRIEKGLTGVISGSDYTVSVYVRVASGTQEVSFGSFEAATFTATTEWQRLTRTQPENDTNAYPRLICEDAATIEVWGFQYEQGSFATSYIPTNGSTVTRSAETANGSGDASTFNDSEGVLMAEISALDLSETSSRRLGITKNGTYEGLRLQLGNGNISATVYDGTTNQYNNSVNIDNSIFHKVALKYKTNDFALWIDGIEYFPQSSGSTFVNGTLDDISFDYVGGNPFYGNTKQLQYFDTALNDNELETLTSWVSFQDMAEGQLYTIE